MTQTAARRPDAGDPRPRLGELLVASGALSDEQLREALVRQRESGIPLGRFLVESGYVSGPAVAMALADQQGGLVSTEYGFATGHGALPPVQRIDVEADVEEPAPLRLAEPARQPDLSPALAELGDAIESMRTELATLRAESRAEISGLRSELASLRGELALDRTERLAAEAATPVGTRAYATDAHTLLFRVGDRYRFEERDGRAPEPGSVVEVDGTLFDVLRVGPAPVPGYVGACAFLEPCSPDLA